MVKKVSVKDLKPGMFIHDMNCSWLDHPFFGSSLKIENEDVIKKIAGNGIREVYIDTDKGLDVGDASSIKESREKIQKVVDRVVEEKSRVIRPASIHSELIRARKIKNETTRTVKKLMNDVVLGKEIEKEKVEEVVENVIDSVVRNQDALMGLGRLRKTDEYTYNHSVGVCVLMVTFGRFLKFDYRMLREVGVGALMHDIGKTQVPLNILNKPGTLTREELDIMKRHVEYGRALLEETRGIAEASIHAAYQHHERIDGSGYPLGLKGDGIDMTGQAMAIVDVYDAITSDRCYQRKVEPTQALRLLFEWSGFQYSGELVQKFIRCVGIYPVGSLVRLESGLLGLVLSHSEKNLLQPVVRIVYDTRKDDYVSIPYDMDLSQPSAGGDRIVSYEIPSRWHIYPDAYL